AADRKAESMFCDLADFGVNGRIGEEDAVGVVRDISAVQELPRLAVGEDLPRGDDPGVGVIKALVGRPGDLTVLVGNEDAVALVDRQPRWSDSFFEGHGW